MNRRYYLVIIFLLSIRFFGSAQLLSQEIKDPEAEFARIRTLAFDGKLDIASADARKLVNSFPAYGDARILLGRILAWKKDYSNATAVIDTLLMSEPGNADALAAKSDILRWSKENTPVSTGIRTGYSFDTFSDPYSRFWQVFNAGAEHRFKRGLVAGGLNIGNAIIGEPAPDNATEWQLEVEAYPKITDKNYAYLAYAYSPGIYFPGHRAALEVWQVLPAGWAISAGMNYYYFDRNIFLALASVEKYLGRYWLSLRGYLYFKDNGLTTSEYFNVRRYFNDVNYLQLTIGAGTAPDEPFDIQTDLMRLSAYSVRLAYNVSLRPRLMMKIGAGYSYEEYQENIWRNRFEGNINFIYAIKMK
ncbi:MAG: YaiO family outer membrane beta-barrel protein [Bacteroidales bacterium]|nr:YaiO family outer membrane beta-barrel protein [Bacteroidales bacterium]